MNAPTTDHPRSRGVYICTTASSGEAPGSSPLARGLPRRRRHARHPARIIPARAGFTQRPLEQGVSLEDHPRSRGVYIPRRAVLAAIRGSSPLARGLLYQAARRGDSFGIIPARAGFTKAIVRMANANKDHPRSRGVYSHLRSSWRILTGSSPLARGLPRARCARRNNCRIIPARAGFTQ